MNRFLPLVLLAGLSSGCSVDLDPVRPESQGVLMELGPRTDLDDGSAFIRVRFKDEERRVQTLPGTWDTASVRLEHPSRLLGVRTGTLIKNTDLLPDGNGGYRAVGALGGALRPVSGYTLTASLWNGGVGGMLAGEKRQALTLVSGVNAISLPIEVYPSLGLSSFSPSSGIPGEVVGLSGQAFSVVPGYDQVKLGTTIATFSVGSSVSISAIVPELGPSLYTWQVKVGTRTANRSGFTVLGTIGSTLSWVALSSAQVEPDIAFGPGEYMAVWKDDRNSVKTDIYATRIAADGTPIGSDFVVLDNGEILSQPSIAYNSGLSRYVVVWRDGDAAGNVFGQVLGADGARIGSTVDIATGSATGKNPHVAYNAFSGKSLVTHTGANDLYAQVLDGNGARIGNSVPVFEGAGTQDRSYIVSCPGSDGFLVLWQDQSPVRTTVRGRLVSSSGVMGYGPFDIGVDPSYDQVEPAGACAESSGDFYVAWVSRTSPHSLLGQWIAADGTLVGGPITLSNASGNKTFPRVSYEAWRQKFVVSWSDNRNSTTDVFGQFVTLDGTLWGTNFVIKSGAGDQTPHEVAIDTVNQRGMVVYQDSASSGNIYGQMIR